ncbi:hypothetical protein CN311_07640 [Mesorhizobium sanjuanii]|uniref:Uncharacterized protein n=1 Tax=Mesorhizobium sanjuanii TaxID=2037900 RepID=A0A2A6FJ76_9HYPH|nr:hypothetical protein CN311_07640 [Mesorhizobium sanjuanii]
MGEAGILLKWNVTDHLSDDPIIRCDVAGRVLEFFESHGVGQHGAGADRSVLEDVSLQFEQILTSATKATAFVTKLKTQTLAILGWLKHSPR